MHFYLTFNDTPSGIYSSQVIDVVKFIKSEFKINIKLVAFISLRNFLFNRSQIKNELPNSLVLPMFPGVNNWKLNRFLFSLICFLFKPKTIIGRSVLATQLALKQKSKSKIIYDGRGAITEEWHEYNVITDSVMLNEIDSLEKECVLKSDFRIAVSNQLIDLWKKKYDYNDLNHVVIPCTLNAIFENNDITSNLIKENKKLLGINENDIVFVYSGSLAGWQSFQLLYDFVKSVLLANNNSKFFFLSDEDENIKKLKVEFKDRIICKKVFPSEVPNYLSIGDFGLLIREKSITNQVASPVKFAEYLACGLQVIISNQLGDYSEFVKVNKCGFNNIDFNINNFQATLSKEEIKKIALDNFSKKSFNESYKKVIQL